MQWELVKPKHFIIFPALFLLIGTMLWKTLPHRLIYAIVAVFIGIHLLNIFCTLYDKYIFKPKKVMPTGKYIPPKPHGKYREMLNDFCIIMFALIACLVWYTVIIYFWHWVCVGVVFH